MIIRVKTEDTGASYLVKNPKFTEKGIVGRVHVDFGDGDKPEYTRNENTFPWKPRTGETYNKKFYVKSYEVVSF